MGAPRTASPSDPTEPQDDASRASSKALSLPSGLPEAPKVPGYSLVEPLGAGGFARAWKAVQSRTGKLVAVKVFFQHAGLDWLFLQREVERLVSLDKHPHVVSLLDADLSHDPPYYVMELMAGGALEDRLRGGARAAPEDVASWLEEVARALSYVHSKGVIHCDLKPANLLLDDEGRVRVADFGQARNAAEAGSLGTVFYMAPEQARLALEGSVQPDVRWDVYSLGATAWALLTGAPPRAGEASRRRLNETAGIAERLEAYRRIAQEPLPPLSASAGAPVDEDVEAIVLRCLEPDPARRYPTAQDLLDDLRARRERRPVSPLAHLRGYRARRFAQRHAAPVAVATLAAAALAWTGAQLALKNRELKGQLAASHMLRGYQLADSGAGAEAALHFLASDRIEPSASARANARAHLRGARLPLHVLEHGDHVTVAAFSPDGGRLVTGGYDGTVRLVDVASGRELSRLRAEGQVTDAAFDPAFERILVGVKDKTARVFELASGKALGRPIEADGNLYSVAWSRDGKLLATGSNKGTVRVWDAERLSPVGPELRHADRVVALRFGPDDSRLLSASYDGTARLWDRRSGRLLREFKDEDRLYAADLSPDGRLVATGGRSRSALVWDARTGERVGPELAHKDTVRSVAFSRDGELLVTGSSDRTASVWRLPSGERVRHILGHGQGVKRAALDPGASRLLTASYDGTACLWDLSEAEARVLKTGEKVLGAAFSTDGRRVATADWGGSVRFWDVETGRPAGPVLRHALAASSVAIGPDGRVLTGGYDRLARLWDADGRPLATLAHKGEVHRVAFGPGGTLLATTSQDKTARLWRPDGTPDGPPLKHGNVVYGLALFGGRLLTSSADGSIRVWDLARREELLRIEAPDEKQRAAVFSPDGSRILAGSSEGRARVWDASSGAQQGGLLRHDAGIYDAAWSPDGRTLATASADATARLWWAETGERLGPSLAHGGGVFAVAFSPDGRLLLTASADGAARLWDVSWLGRDPPASELLALAEVAAQQRLDRRGELVDLPRDEWVRRVRELAKARAGEAR